MREPGPGFLRRQIQLATTGSPGSAQAAGPSPAARRCATRPSRRRRCSTRRRWSPPGARCCRTPRHGGAPHSHRDPRPGRLRRRGGLATAPCLHHRHRLGHRPGHQGGAGPCSSCSRPTGSAACPPPTATSRPSPERQGHSAEGRPQATACGSRGWIASADEEVVAVARCGDEVAVTDPGATPCASRPAIWSATSTPTSRSTGPGTPCTEGASSLAHARTARALRSPGRRGRPSPTATTRCCSVSGGRSTSSAASTRRSRCRAPSSLGYYTIRITSDDQEATETFEVQEYRKPEFEVHRLAGGAIRPAGRTRRRSTVAARYYFGQPVAGGDVNYTVRSARLYYSPLRWSDDAPDEESSGGGWYGGDETGRARRGLDRTAEPRSTVPADGGTTRGATTRSASRPA